MTCHDFENRLHELLDRRQRELPDELYAHAARCSACHDLCERFQRLLGAVSVWRAPDLPVELADAVLRQLQSEPDATTRSPIVTRSTHTPATHLSNRRSALACFAALCATSLALLITVGIGWRISGNAALAKRQADSQSSIAVNRVEPPAAAEQANDRQLEILLHDARDAYVALASQAWQQVSTADVLLPPTDTPSPFSADQSLPNVPETLSRPLAPLGQELRDAVDSWLQQVFNSQESAT